MTGTIKWRGGQVTRIEALTDAVFGFFLVFALMYRHAYRMREELELSQEDVFYAQDHMATCLVMCGIGVLSIIVAYAVPWQLSGLLAGFTYGLIGPAVWLLHAKWIKPRRERLGSVPAR